MKYYRVKPDFIGVRIQKTKKHTPIETIRNEMFTKKELIKLGCINDPMLNVMFETVNLSPKKVYFLFGARFEIGKGARD
jgi:hypothetical protein